MRLVARHLHYDQRANSSHVRKTGTRQVTGFVSSTSDGAHPLAVSRVVMEEAPVEMQ
jgi:hypothetical protein